MHSTQEINACQFSLMKPGIFDIKVTQDVLGKGPYHPEIIPLQVAEWLKAIYQPL